MRRPHRSLRTLFFQFWFRISRPVTLGVRGMVIDDRGRVLLVRHTYVSGWHFPGGGVEHREPAALSLERELAEEAGIRMTAPPRLLGIYSNHDRFPNDHVLTFIVETWEPCEATSQGEIAEIGWFAFDRLPEDVTPGTAARVREYLRGGPVSRYFNPGIETE